jgi:hypothetical protein
MYWKNQELRRFPMAVITSSEIAKIARIGRSAVQKQYILTVSIHTG